MLLSAWICVQSLASGQLCSVRLDQIFSPELSLTSGLLLCSIDCMTLRTLSVSLLTAHPARRTCCGVPGNLSGDLRHT